MDREAAVIRAEMSQTRADLDAKITRLEERARELSPKRVAERYMPDYLLDRAIGAVLTAVGTMLTVRHYRGPWSRRARVRAAYASYGRW